MESKYKVLTILIIFIFLVFVSYNISNYMVHSKYSKITGTNMEIDELKSMIINNASVKDVLSKVNKIDEQIKFEHAVCFDEEQENGSS